MKTWKSWKPKINRADVERVLIACSAALVLLLAVQGGGQKTTDMYEEPFDQIPVERTSVTMQAPTQPTIVYYKDGNGYLVPVEREIEKQDGIAKATLALMVKDAKNDMEAARMGLLTVLPEGTKVDLDISGGHARVDLSAEVLNTADAEEESRIVQAVVNTLTEFDTVKDVEFLVDGQKRSRLTHGTDVSGRMTRTHLNLESETAAVSAFSKANQVQLYFPSESGRLLVPVTRTVYSDADVETAIFEFLKGPKDDSGLEKPLPEETGLLGVTVKDGVATINFTGEFLDIAKNSDGGVQAMRALMLTCTQFPGVKKVEVLVDGEKYTMPLVSAPTFANIESEVVETFPEVMSVE